MLRRTRRTTGKRNVITITDIPALAQKDNYIGIKDFPGRVIQAYETEGWIFHGRIVISKNPQAQAIRTHSKGLLFVQLKKDSIFPTPVGVNRPQLAKNQQPWHFPHARGGEPMTLLNFVAV